MAQFNATLPHASLSPGYARGEELQNFARHIFHGVWRLRVGFFRLFAILVVVVPDNLCVMPADALNKILNGSLVNA